MIRYISIGLWVGAIVFVSIFFGIKYEKDKQVLEAKELADIVDGASDYTYTRTDLMTIPVMINGSVRGYVVTQLIYAIDKSTAWSLGRSVSYFIADEIYSQLFKSYSNTAMVERISFNDIKKAIINNVNKRFGKDILKDVLVQQFGYVSQTALNNLQVHKNNLDLRKKTT